MDKRQREIITSYFRAREIAVKQGQDAYKSYEINKFSLDNYIDIDNIDVNTRDMSNKLHELFYSDPVGIFNKMKLETSFTKVFLQSGFFISFQIVEHNHDDTHYKK